MEGIKQTFAKCKAEKRSALVAYVTAGYPAAEDSVEVMLGMEEGGAGKYFFLSPYLAARHVASRFIT